MNALVIDKLNVNRGGLPVVRNASLVVDEGTITVLLGANGAGKTTLLEGIAGAVAAVFTKCARSVRIVDTMRVFLAVALLCAPASAAAGACAVDQVRLALAATSTSMTVVWATGNVSTPAGYSGVVTYGTSPGALTSTSAPGDSRNYTIDSQGSPFLHMATATGLTPGTRYFYQVVAAAGAPACAPSPVLNFTAAPVVGDARAYPIRIASYGDMGISYSKNTAAFLAELAAAGSVDLIIHAGDISYADNRGSTDRDGGYENVQNTYYNEVSPYQSLVPAMYSSGNVRFALAPAAVSTATYALSLAAAGAGPRSRPPPPSRWFRQQTPVRARRARHATSPASRPRARSTRPTLARRRASSPTALAWRRQCPARRRRGRRSITLSTMAACTLSPLTPTSRGRRAPRSILGSSATSPPWTGA